MYYCTTLDKTVRASDIGFRSDNSTANGPPSNYLAELTGSPQVFEPWQRTYLRWVRTYARIVCRRECVRPTCVNVLYKREKKGEGISFLWKRPLITTPTRNPEQLQLVTLNLLGPTLYCREINSLNPNGNFDRVNYKEWL